MCSRFESFHSLCIYVYITVEMKILLLFFFSFFVLFLKLSCSLPSVWLFYTYKTVSVQFTFLPLISGNSIIVDRTEKRSEFHHLHYHHLFLTYKNLCVIFRLGLIYLPPNKTLLKASQTKTFHHWIFSYLFHFWSLKNSTLRWYC